MKASLNEFLSIMKQEDGQVYTESSDKEVQMKHMKKKSILSYF